MNKKKFAVKVVITFVEAVVATAPFTDGVTKLAVAGAIGAGVSAVWNLVFYPQLQSWLSK